MDVIHYPDDAPPARWYQPVLALGNFDGVHRGHRAVIEQLFKARQSVRELPDGCALGLPADDDTLLLAARFIMLERRCCPFFDFALEVEREGGPLWLRLSGREGAKEVLRTEFDLA